MAFVVKLQEFGNQIAVIYDDGSRALAYPTQGGFWFVTEPGATEPPVDPPPASGVLKDYWIGAWGWISGTWEDHASYSRGGTDYPAGMDDVIRTPAAGTLVNFGNDDAAGLKSMVVFDKPYPRKTAASNTLMNGVYRENTTAPAVAVMLQHLNRQLPEGWYGQGAIVAHAGNTAGPGSTGDTHLHAHLLAAASVGADRLDFRKFL